MIRKLRKLLAQLRERWTQKTCDHVVRLEDIRRNDAGLVEGQCIECFKVLSADCGLHLRCQWAEKRKECGCRKCCEGIKDPLFGLPITSTRFIVCEYCGNKRCPHATHHKNHCTHSNDSGQPGSVFQ